MIKFNLFFACALILANLCTIGVNAQTKIWGAGASAGSADGEFQNAFTQTGVAGSYSATAWTALSVNENDGSVTPGNAYWTRSLLGYSQGNFAGNTPMTSPSRVNGVAIFDSGFMDNNGTSALGTGTSPAGHRGELISPRIDLTGYANTPLVVQFFSEYREFQINELSLSMSIDDGLTWSTPSNYRILQASNTGGMVRVMMPDITNGATVLNQCRVRFVFDNQYYYAMVDDVTVETAPAYDLAMGNADPNGSLLVENGDFVKIGGNRYQSLSNLDPTNLKEWFWGGKVINYGAQTILPQDNAKIHVAIDFVDAITNVVTTDVYLDSMDIDTLVGGAAGSAPFIDYVDNLNFITTNGRGDYRVKYWVSHNNTDAIATNDTVSHTFSITGTVTSYISKARRASSDGRVFASRGIFPGGVNPISAFEYGSVYYFPKGLTSGLTIDSIEFRYQVPNGYTGPATESLAIKIYKLTDGSGGTASNGVLDSDELLEVGLGVANLTGLGTTTAAGSYGLGVVSNLYDASGVPFSGLDDHGLYYISLLQSPSVFGGAGTFTSSTGLWFGADEYNYYMNAAMSLSDTIINPSPSATTDAAGITTWFWTGFGADMVPSIGLHLAPTPSSTSNLMIQEGEEIGLSVFPNPITTNLNFKVEFEEARDVRYILTDVSGRVLLLFNSDNVTEETKSINIEKFPTGIYFLTAETAQGSKTKRIIKK
jgi:hypothetical protein